MTAGHHGMCHERWTDCTCAALWAAEDETHDGLDDWYARFYDPDCDDDPAEPSTSYADQDVRADDGEAR